MCDAQDNALMDEALALAAKGGAWVSPNPMVGALVVRDGQIVGRGWHQRHGGPHAEVFALREAGEQARGATLYCTLEPCNHTGKTPPCAQAVIAAGIARVVLGARDPNPVAAGGLATLRAAGIDVLTGVRENECKLLNAAFFKVVRTALPLVSLKWAMSADGKIATATRDSKWISSAASRQFAHALRAQHDAVLVGIGTLLADGARLTCRVPGDAQTAMRQPRRVILDSLARTPLDAPIWGEPDGGAVMIVTGPSAPAERLAALRARGAEILSLDSQAPHPPLRAVLEGLARQKIQSVLVEGGSQVLGAFRDSQLADRAYIFIAPKIIGGADALTPVGGNGAARVSEAPALSEISVERIGDDVLLRGRLGNWSWL